MTNPGMLYQMNHALIDKNPFPGLHGCGVVQSLHRDPPFQDIDKLDVLMPVHHLESRISRKALLIYDFQNQIGKICACVQINRIDKTVVFSHDTLSFSFDLAILEYNLAIFRYYIAISCDIIIKRKNSHVKRGTKNYVFPIR